MTFTGMYLRTFIVTLNQSLRFILSAILMSLCVVLPASADKLQLAIQPILSKSQTEAAYKPLADYLSKVTGHTITVKASFTFLDYWEDMRKNNGFDLVLDAAHFTDYRVQKMGYTVLVKVKDTVSYSLASHEDQLVFDPEELIGKKIAIIPSPSLGGVRLAEMFPNPLRQPRIVGTNNSTEALKKLRDKKVDAILIPTPMTRGVNSINIISTTQPVPHIALSASPKVDLTTQRAIRKALLDAPKTPAGEAMLKAINLGGFEKASNTTYKGYARLLQGVWGY